MTDFQPVSTPNPPASVLTKRQERKLRYLGADGRMHTLIVQDLYSVDDTTINMAKAFQFSLITGTGYNRPETPRKLKGILTRTSLVW